MGTRKINQTINGDFQLSEPIIQHIQSFLTAKQAAHTTTLSKSWRKAWLTRPNLDFDESDFQRSRNSYSEISEFSEFAKNTIRRYEESNLKIGSLRLILVRRLWQGDNGFARELIVKALKMGAVHLIFRPNDLNFVLPHEVFVAENLVGLSVEGCKIDLGLDRMDLTLQSFNCENDMLISSRSLERLNFLMHKSLRVKLDVPSIRKFTFEGSVIPLLSFKSTSREWESHVSIKYYHPLSMLWFDKLNKFLTELSSSKIHLSLHVISGMSFDYEVGDILGLPKPQVENLTIETQSLPSLTCYALFDGLFRLCRPKFVTKYLLPKSSIGDDFLCKALVQGMNEKCSIRSHCMDGLHDLEEVNVQIFDQVVAVWQDMPWKTFLDASMSSKDKQKIRFQLKWKS